MKRPTRLQQQLLFRIRPPYLRQWPRHRHQLLAVADEESVFDHSRFDNWKKLRLDDALRKLGEFQGEVHPNVYALLARKCSDLATGICVHDHIQQSRYDGDRYLANLLVDMYGRCGSVARAVRVFQGIADPNIYSWTMLMAAYAQNGHFAEALQAYRRLQVEGLRLDNVVLVTAVDACTACGDLEQGRRIHSCALESQETSSNLILANSLLNMYGKCGHVGEAERLFHATWPKDVVSWTAMLVVYAHNCCWTQALGWLQRMDFEGVKANQVTFVSIVDVCAKLRLVEHGRWIHQRIMATSGMEQPDPILANALLHMYGRCGCFEEMRSVFEGMHSNSASVLWTTMISGCCHNGEYGEGLVVFRRMELEGVKANEMTLMSMIGVCQNLGALEQGETIHSRMLLLGCGGSSPVYNKLLGTSLISFYGRCGRLERSKEVLELTAERDVVAWNAIVAACAQNGDNRGAFQALRVMDLEGFRANEVTFISALEACSNLLNEASAAAALGWGQRIHARIVLEGLLEREVALGNSLISMYGRCGRVADARGVFSCMGRRDDVSWNALMNASVENSEFGPAVALFRCMDLEGVRASEFTLLSLVEACSGLADLRLSRAIHRRAAGGGFGVASSATGNSIINMYAKCGSLDEAFQAFDELGEHRNLISWSILLAAVAQSKQEGRGVFKVWMEMEAEGIKAGEAALVSVLDACAAMATVEHGRRFHRRATETGVLQSSLLVANTAISMYGRCGSPGEAKVVFDAMQVRCAVSWNALIAAYAHNGHAEEALELLQGMLLEGLDPDTGTSVSILYGLSHAGLLEKGLEHFCSSVSDHGMVATPGQYKCLVDMLARKGFVAEAEEVIECMQCQSDPVAWMALLAGCKSYGDSERGIRAAERIVELEPHHSGSYVMLANIYSSVGRWADAARVRKLMQVMNVKKEAGCSWIEVNGCVHEFVSGGSKHPKAKLIFSELQMLTMRIKEAGYVPDSSAVVLDVDEKHKEDILARHSERQAIAFALLYTAQGSTIRIVKNLRVCSDCHAATKIISCVVEREIVVRDSSRFHHFRRGSCSCGDFW